MISASRIFVNNHRCYAYHGCLPEEALIGGHYRVDAVLDVDFIQAAIHDDLSQTADYCEVREIIDREMKIRSKLIEHVAKRIGDAMMAEISTIRSLQLTVTKIAPPTGGDIESVAVQLEFKRG